MTPNHSSLSEDSPTRGWFDLATIRPSIEAEDQARFRRITSIEISPEAATRIAQPTMQYPEQDAVLAIHWHPEFVPVSLIQSRVQVMYPAMTDQLIIPTQHNVITSYGEYSGVEIDAYAPDFNRKVQFLVHMTNERAAKADTLKNMLRHTFNYRASQLHEFIDSMLEPRYADRVEAAVRLTGAPEDLVSFIVAHVRKIRMMIRDYGHDAPLEMLRNKIIRDYFDTMREEYDDHLINQIQSFVKTMKEIVKEKFSLEYFYRDWEFIEECRSVGACIVVPHPEQFWPVLLCDYDLDGYEVWNPQSLEFTEFLIRVVMRENKRRARSSRQLLITMGDDCHMGEKVKHPAIQDRVKAAREIGFQPAWDEPRIQKALHAAQADRRILMTEYQERLHG